MRVLMLRAQMGSPTPGITKRYHAGREYDLPDELGLVFVDEGWAKALTGPVEKKVIPAAPQNKSGQAVPQQPFRPAPVAGANSSNPGKRPQLGVGGPRPIRSGS